MGDGGYARPMALSRLSTVTWPPTGNALGYHRNGLGFDADSMPNGTHTGGERWWPMWK